MKVNFSPLSEENDIYHTCLKAEIIILIEIHIIIIMRIQVNIIIFVDSETL